MTAVDDIHLARPQAGSQFLDVSTGVDDPAPVTYDRLDWHHDSAIAAGQPPENAFTHIGLYLAWIIRHDLHDSRFFPADHVAAVKGFEMTGSDLSDDIDTKLMPLLMNAEGQAFSDARYGTYLDEYATVFGVTRTMASPTTIRPTLGSPR